MAHRETSVVHNGSPESGSIRRLLIVDDHPIFCLGLVSLLNSFQDLEVCAQAAGAEQAFGLILAEKPDLVIADIGLVGASGFDLLVRIEEVNIPQRVLVLSIHEELVYAPRALKAGAIGYVMKREAPDHIVGQIRRALAGELAVSSAVMQMLALNAVGRATPANGPESLLAPREMEVFMLIGQGSTTRQIAEQLSLGVKTVETYRSHVRRRLGLANAAELVRVATLWFASNRVEAGSSDANWPDTGRATT